MPSTKSNGKKIKKTKKRKAGENTEGITENMDDQDIEKKGTNIDPNIESENTELEKKIVPKFGKKMKITQTQEFSEVRQKVERSVESQDNKTEDESDPSQAERSRSSDEVTCQNSTTTNSNSSLKESSNEDNKQTQNDRTMDDKGNMENDIEGIIDEVTLKTEHESVGNLNVPQYNEQIMCEIPTPSETLNVHQANDDSHFGIDRKTDVGCHGNEPDSCSHGNEPDDVTAKSNSFESMIQNKTESPGSKDKVTSSNCSQESQEFEVHADFELQNEIVDHIKESVNVKNDNDIPSSNENAVSMATSDSYATENVCLATISNDVNTECSVLATASIDLNTAATHSLANHMKEIHNVTNQNDGKHDGVTNQNDGKHDGMTNAINRLDDCMTRNIMDISAGGDTFRIDIADKDKIVTETGDLPGGELTKEDCHMDTNVAEHLNMEKDCSSVKKENNLNSGTEIQNVLAENQKIGKSVENTSDEITDSQLCALDWTVSEEKASSKPLSKTLNSHNTPVQEVSTLPVLPSGTTVVKGLIQQLSQLNMMILRTRREMESYRRQMGQKQQRRPLQTNMHNNIYK